MESILWAIGCNLDFLRSAVVLKACTVELLHIVPLPVMGNSGITPKIHWSLSQFLHPIAQIFGIGAHH